MQAPVRVAPGFRLALRASGMTGFDFKQRIAFARTNVLRDASSSSPQIGRRGACSHAVGSASAALLRLLRVYTRPVD